MQSELPPYSDDESMPDDLELVLSPKLAELGDRLSADADSIAAHYAIEASTAFGAEFWARRMRRWTVQARMNHIASNLGTDRGGGLSLRRAQRRPV